MKLSWRDVVASVLAVLGGVVVFAKLQSYSWTFLGSWKGALGVLAVIGLGILATYFVDWFRNEDTGIVWEALLWITTATITVAGLIVTTTKAEFVWAASFIGLSWLAQLGAHAWDSSHSHTPHYVASH